MREKEKAQGILSQMYKHQQTKWEIGKLGNLNGIGNGLSPQY